MAVKTAAIVILWLLTTVGTAIPTWNGPDLLLTTIPQDSYHVVVRAYKSLPPRLQKALQEGRKIDVTLKEGNVLGAAFASDNLGMPIDLQTVYVRWPAGTETIAFPWGKIRLIDATRHELAHLALERIFSQSSQVWTKLIDALQEEDNEFFKKVALGNKDATDIRSSSAMAHYQSLHEYLASLIEHCGRPVRMPLPSGRARPMVEALVNGGTCPWV